jgi:hypothetical protein
MRWRGSLRGSALQLFLVVDAKAVVRDTLDQLRGRLGQQRWLRTIGVLVRKIRVGRVGVDVGNHLAAV